MDSPSFFLLLPLNLLRPEFGKGNLVEVATGKLSRAIHLSLLCIKFLQLSCVVLCIIILVTGPVK